ncbi:MAG: hypothetical protein EXR73_05730 [Myxococcales bacterium]|nr:hypothetical protein [Myxococcales bacterium]
MSSAPLQQLLVDAEVAYDRGDYAGTRRCAVELLAAAPPDDLAGPARELLARLRPDRAAVVLTGLCAALFALVVGRYVF